jgi:CTP:molybdopterin cytidylyltransferase MocA
VSGSPLIILAAGRAVRFGGVKPLAGIGPDHEAIVDLLTSDAVSAGFSSVVVVVNPDFGPEIRAHISRAWPSTLDVSFAVQQTPRGTVDAVLSARAEMDTSKAFAVVNADDLYGTEALSACAGHLSSRGSNVLVGYRLRNAIVGTEPVTRGVCTVEDGALISISERRSVVAVGDHFESRDGLEPVVLDPETVVSMNLWGFAPEMWGVFEEATDLAERSGSDAEILLPEVVGSMLREELSVSDAVRDVSVIVTEQRCVGITHPGDLEVVRADLAAQIERGERPRALFGRGAAAER